MRPKCLQGTPIVVPPGPPPTPNLPMIVGLAEHLQRSGSVRVVRPVRCLQSRGWKLLLHDTDVGPADLHYADRVACELKLRHVTMF